MQTNFHVLLIKYHSDLTMYLHSGNLKNYTILFDVINSFTK